MKKFSLITTSIISSFLVILPSYAENLTDLSQLLNTNQCAGCNLSKAGLVMTQLAGADLSGANLVGANLSRADLTGANLTGANLSGASLYGANLSGANLSGANLRNTDLRNAYLVDTIFTNTELSNADIQGAVGISASAANAEQFYMWGVKEDQKGNYQAAYNYYSQAINLNPEFAPAHLAKAVISSRMGKTDKAIQQGEKAEELFTAQQNLEGIQLSTRFIALVKAREDLDEEQNNQGKNSSFVNIINSVAPLLFKFILP